MPETKAPKPALILVELCSRHWEEGGWQHHGSRRRQPWRRWRRGLLPWPRPAAWQAEGWEHAGSRDGELGSSPHGSERLCPTPPQTSGANKVQTKWAAKRPLQQGPAARHPPPCCLTSLCWGQAAGCRGGRRGAGGALPGEAQAHVRVRLHLTNVLF